jgi:hypothetical protein
MVKQIGLEVLRRWNNNDYATSNGPDEAFQKCELALAGGIIRQLEHARSVCADIREAMSQMEPAQNCLTAMFPGFDPL